MRKEIEKLIDDFDEFISEKNSEAGANEFGKKDVRKYQELMVRLFAVLKEEWKGSKVNKDIALLVATFGAFIQRSDDDGNVLGSEDYDRATTFNAFFKTDLFQYDYFRFDEEGKLMVDGFEDVLHIDTETFELPSLDEIYG